MFLHRRARPQRVADVFQDPLLVTVAVCCTALILAFAIWALAGPVLRHV
jgi:hypothetical protein